MRNALWFLDTLKYMISWEPDRKPLVVPGCQPCGDIRLQPTPPPSWLWARFFLRETEVTRAAPSGAVRPVHGVKLPRTLLLVVARGRGFGELAPTPKGRRPLHVAHKLRMVSWFLKNEKDNNS